jgi:hypothetical protein
MAARITQETLRVIANRRAQIQTLQLQVKASELLVLERLKDGVKVAPGLMTARVKEFSRRNVAWKEVVVREIGQDYADRVLNATKPEVYTSLVVELEVNNWLQNVQRLAPKAFAHGKVAGDGEFGLLSCFEPDGVRRLICFRDRSSRQRAVELWDKRRCIVGNECVDDHILINITNPKP